MSDTKIPKREELSLDKEAFDVAAEALSRCKGFALFTVDQAGELVITADTSQLNSAEYSGLEDWCKKGLEEFECNVMLDTIEDSESNDDDASNESAF